MVDHDGSYAKYFEADGGGWVRWRKEHPQAREFVSVSRPVSDEKSGLVLVYSEYSAGFLNGGGAVVLYRNQNGKLIELKRAELWVS